MAARTDPMPRRGVSEIRSGGLRCEGLSCSAGKPPSLASIRLALFACSESTRPALNQIMSPSFLNFQPARTGYIRKLVRVQQDVTTKRGRQFPPNWRPCGGHLRKAERVTVSQCQDQHRQQALVRPCVFERHLKDCTSPGETRLCDAPENHHVGNLAPVEAARASDAVPMHAVRGWIATKAAAISDDRPDQRIGVAPDLFSIVDMHAADDLWWITEKFRLTSDILATFE
jgi:hypothetical protein